MLKRGKKASSHIEVVLSVVLFVFFVTFLIAYVKPYQQTSIKDSVIISVKNSFEHENTIDVSRIFLKATDTKGCFSVDLSSYGFSGNSLGRQVINDDSSALVNSNFANNILTLPSRGSFYVLISPEFNAVNLQCDEQEEADVSIGSIEKMKMLSESSLNNFKGRYSNDYDNLKKDLKIPQETDFSIISSDGKYKLEKIIPEQVEVISKSFLYEVLNHDGSIENKEFIIKVW